MIILTQQTINQAIATCSRNKTLTGSVNYLWSIRHKLSEQSWKFIPYRIEPSVDYNPPYDVFRIEVDEDKVENYIGTSGNSVNLHLIPGEYYLKIYEQVSPTNLDPSLSYDVVYEGMIITKENLINVDIDYTGFTDTTIIYEPD